MQRLELGIWCIAVSSFVGLRVVTGVNSWNGTIIGGVICGFCLGGYINPYLFGREISLPSFPDTKFVKGKDDFIRMVWFLISISLFYSGMKGGW